MLCCVELCCRNPSSLDSNTLPPLPPPLLEGIEYRRDQGATDVRPAARGTEEMFGCVVKSVEIGMNTRLLRPCTAYHTTYEHVGVPVCWPIECPFIVHDYGLHVSLLSVIHLYLSLLSVTLIHLFTCLSLLSLSHIVLSLLQEPRHSERRRIPAHTVREKGGLWSHCTRPCMGLLVQESCCERPSRAGAGAIGRVRGLIHT